MRASIDCALQRVSTRLGEEGAESVHEADETVHERHGDGEEGRRLAGHLEQHVCLLAGAVRAACEKRRQGTTSFGRKVMGNILRAC